MKRFCYDKCKLTLMTVWPLSSHMTRGFGYPVTLQTNLAHWPSLTSSGSGWVTKHGLNFSVSASMRSVALSMW